MKLRTIVLVMLVLLAVAGLPVLAVLPHGGHAMPDDSYSSTACAVACLTVSALFLWAFLVVLFRRFVHDAPLMFSGADAVAVDPPPPRALLA